MTTKEDSFRAACLILQNGLTPRKAVQEAFLRAWRFRTSMPEGDGLRPWLSRVLVNPCFSRLRKDRPTREGCLDNGWEALEALPGPNPSR